MTMPCPAPLSKGHQSSSESRACARGNTFCAFFVELHCPNPSGTGLRREDVQWEASKWKQEVPCTQTAWWGKLRALCLQGEDNPGPSGLPPGPGDGSCCHEQGTVCQQCHRAAALGGSLRQEQRGPLRECFGVARERSRGSRPNGTWRAPRESCLLAPSSPCCRSPGCPSCGRARRWSRRCELCARTCASGPSSSRPTATRASRR